MLSLKNRTHTFCELWRRFKLHSFCEGMRVYLCARVHMYRSEDTLWDSVLSFWAVGWNSGCHLCLVIPWLVCLHFSFHPCWWRLKIHQNPFLLLLLNLRVLLSTPAWDVGNLEEADFVITVSEVWVHGYLFTQFQLILCSCGRRLYGGCWVSLDPAKPSCCLVQESDLR